MKRLVLLFVVILAAAPHPTTAQTIDDAAVDVAIKAGQAKRFKQLISECDAKPGFGAGVAANMAGGVQPTGRYSVIVSRALGRIAFLAADAKRLYKPFALADVTPEMRTDTTVFVTVIPDDPDRSSKAILVASPIERVVLRGPASSVVQPSDVALTPVEWSNLLGGKVHANSAVATFSAEEVRGLPAGDIDVIVIAAAGERRCKVGQNDRLRVLNAK